jgi:hypothetical protein
MCFISILLYFGLILFGYKNFKNYKIHLLLYICSAIFCWTNCNLYEFKFRK